jgi:hypothetical protein
VAGSCEYGDEIIGFWSHGVSFHLSRRTYRTALQQVLNISTAFSMTSTVLNVFRENVYVSGLM